MFRKIMINMRGLVLPITWLFLMMLHMSRSSVIDYQRDSNKPLLLLVSFDGFRWDYLYMYNLPNFNYIKNLGSHAEYIKNSFATVTFPNHWTIVTGLYEESHGILQNNMFDPTLNKTFNYKSNESQTIEWYGQNKAAEPIWITNQKAGDSRLSAAEWIGSNIVFGDTNIVQIPYNRSKTYRELIDQFIGLFTRKFEPINFGALYFDEPDHTGHLYGPYSIQMKQKLEEIDLDLGYLIKQLKMYNLFHRLNIIITSDHGMDTISNNTAVFLDSYIDTSLFNAYGSRACYSIFVKKDSDLEYVYQTLNMIPNVKVYKKESIPEQYNYKHNVRVGDIFLVTNIGYAVYVNQENVNWTINNGDHGYDNNESSMHPIFMAHGPAFKKNFKTKPFNNVDIYPLMCSILGIKPAVNNGTIRNVEAMLVQNSNLFIIFAFVILTPMVSALFTSLYVLHVSKRAYAQYQSITINKEPLALTLDSQTQLDFFVNKPSDKKIDYLNSLDWKRRSV